jgi:hypothetical protein
MVPWEIRIIFGWGWRSGNGISSGKKIGARGVDVFKIGIWRLDGFFMV